MGMTITEKILAAHCGRDKVVPGEIVNAVIDLIVAHDVTTPPAVAMLKKIGIDRVFDPTKILVTPDHFVPNKDIKSAELAKQLREWRIEQGIERYYEIGNHGICHAIAPEQGHVLPGMTIVCGDSHTTTMGALGTFASGVGSTDLAAALRKARELADPQNARTTVVVLLTDGEDLAGAGRQAARELADQGLVVHAVGYGSAYGSKITVAQGGSEAFLKDKDGAEVVSKMDPDSLRELAAATGGEFLRAEAMALPLNQLHQGRLQPMQKRSYDAGEETGKRTRYQWALLPLLVLLLWEIAMAGGRCR